MNIFPKQRIKIGLRQQLLILVVISVSLSLMVLAIITGVFFSYNFKNSQAKNLSVISQLKSSQIEQNLMNSYFQIYWVSQREPIQNSLISYRAGNTSSTNFIDAQDTLEQFLGSSNTFSNVRLYDAKFRQVVNSTDSTQGKYTPDNILDQVFPFDQNITDFPSIMEYFGIINGPIKNSSTYIMSMTLPVYGSVSIIYGSSDLVGYITAVMSAESLRATQNDSVLDTNVQIISTNLSNIDDNSTYHYVLPSSDVPDDLVGQNLPMNSNSVAEQVLRYNKTGVEYSIKMASNKKVAAAYCPIDFPMVKWAAIVEQKRSDFLYSTNQLTKIMIIVSIATAVLMFILAIPLAHWSVTPILRLQKATETIAAGRGLQTLSSKKHKHQSSKGGSMSSFLSGPKPPPPAPPAPHSNTNNDDQGYTSGQGSGYNSHRSSIGSTRSFHTNSAYGSNIGDTSRYHNNHNNSLSGNNTDNENGSLSSGIQGHTSYISGARVPTYTRFFRDELSKLTETFNIMTDELDRQYSHLEDRVKARTKQLEAAKIQAEAANEAKTVFIANISHELRTPLNGILGMTAIAMAEEEPNKIQQSLKLIFRSGELLLHILTELLTFSKNSLKRSNLENSDFGVLDVALQIKSIFGKLAKDQNVNLSINLTPNSARKMVLYGDSNRIIQVVMNLVSNSLKFTPVDGKVTVSIKNLGEYDEEKSSSEDFKQVYVKSIEQINNEKQEQINNNEKQEILNTTTTTTPKTNEYSQSSNDTTSDDDENDSDQKSIVTISTSSYDDQVFQNQFKKIDTNNNGLNETKDLDEQKTWVFEFEVEDTGPGIDQTLQQSVFEPFVQGDQTLSRQYGGTGLGLSICRQLATMMKGVMELESTVGVGSKFTFRVPLIQRKELIISESNVLNFYEDEFNINSKKNRRVKIIEPEKDTLSPDSNLTTSTSIEQLNEKSNTTTTTNTTNTISENNENLAPPNITPTTPGNKSPNSLNISSNGKVRTPTSSNYNDGFEYFDRPILQSTGTAKGSTINLLEQNNNNNNGIESSPKNVNGQDGKNSDSSSIQLKILVAEDNIVNQEVIKRMLRLEGFNNIELAVDGEEAIELVRQNGGDDYYDIIFMDVQMPKCDGLMATKIIRNELKFNNPIVALTAFADESNVKECLDSGMTGFLSKPIRRLQLRQVLTKFCTVILKEMTGTPGTPGTPASEDIKSFQKGNNNNSPRSTKSLKSNKSSGSTISPPDETSEATISTHNLPINEQNNKK
ncbi:Osmosensing histidine protein kinase SLN1 [Wickerhamomyces ciferrii]|uniref:histidine kinase n=1 Tax=Wickerhamomyces ciferrii (strain ATCC 14091 / BCRC 22168 / CBS 111 / JCM 3599 / NBRC 0793 / NRRL Y-1031 F-60-10) TaxID=1206466 RepID=K0KNS6_WICCF|nr:Osmosensing histidine protein kinase SLN1 [Wickerhamomyces ciferrii]CCH43817.1 Osmosensing histidine protein kinase SLN1 [Wickerhamomyces ciferrii]